MKHLPFWMAAVLAASGCGGVEYKDTTAAVDANPLCVSDPDQPNQPVAEACKREQGASWSSARKGEPIDFRSSDDD